MSAPRVEPVWETLLLGPCCQGHPCSRPEPLGKDQVASSAGDPQPQSSRGNSLLLFGEGGAQGAVAPEEDKMLGTAFQNQPADLSPLSPLPPNSVFKPLIPQPVPESTEGVTTRAPTPTSPAQTIRVNREEGRGLGGLPPASRSLLEASRSAQKEASSPVTALWGPRDPEQEQLRVRARGSGRES